MQLGIPQLDKSEFMSRPHRNPGWDYMDIQLQSYGADVALDDGTYLDYFFNPPTQDGKNFVTQFVVGNEVGNHWATVTGWLKLDATGRTQVPLTANDPSWHVANREKGYHPHPVTAPHRAPRALTNTAIERINPPCH